MAAARAEPVERLRLAPALDAVGDVFRERRAVLEPVARAAAHEPPVRPLGMAGDEEVRVGRQVVLADTRADDRRAGERREPPRRVGAGECSRAGSGSRSTRSGSTSRPGPSGEIFIP